MTRHWLPWRPNVREGQTEEDCEDPERLIMFDDLSSFMFEVQADQNRLQLVLSLLSLIDDDSRSLKFTNHPSQSLLSQNIQPYELEGICDMDHTVYWNDPQLSKCCSRVNVHKETRMDFIDRLLQQAVKQFDGNERTQLTRRWINFRTTKLKCSEADLKKDKKRWKSSCKDVKKWIKEILKEEGNRNNIVLWEAYAKFESELGNKDDCVKVLDTVLSMNLQPGGILNLEDTILQYQLCKLCRMYVETELNASKNTHGEQGTLNRENALHVLVSLPNDEEYKTLERDGKVPPPKTLRARRNYQILIDKLLEHYTESMTRSLPDADCGFVHAVVCYAYLQYLTVDVQAASVIFQQVNAL